MSGAARPGYLRAFAAILTAVLCSSALGAAPGKPNIVLVSLDTFRADRLAPWGGRADLAPNLNALCERGVVFKRCFTPAPITLPAHATLLTGMPPSSTGLHDNGTGRLSKDTPTLAEMLSARGYATAAIVSSAVLSSRYGLSRGFASYDDRVGPSGVRASSTVTDLALAQLAARRGRSMFLWVHYFDTHAPYYSMEAFRKRFASPYDAAVATVDEEVGRLLRHLPPDTVVAVVSDHGEGLGDHGEMTHGVLLYQTTVQVLCAIAGPGVPAGLSSSLPSSLADVVPTILALVAGPKGPASLEGRNLLTLGSLEAPPRRTFHLEAWMAYDEFRWVPLTGVTDGRYKWVRGRWDRLYDLDEAPSESKDRASEPPSDAMELRGLLPALATPRDVTADLDPSLRGLGYAPLAGPVADLHSLPDPESQLTVLRGMLQGRLERSSGALDRSATIFEELTSRDPGNPSAWLEYAQTLQLAGRNKDAESAVLRALAIAPRSADAWATLGHARLGMDRPDEALAAYEHAIELSPSSVTTLKALAEYDLIKGKLDKASALIRRVVLSKYADSSAFILQGRILLAQKRPQEVSAAFARALELSPEPARTLKEQGDAYRLSGLPTAAEKAYERGILSYPEFAPTYLALAGLYLQSDEPAMALPILKRALRRDLPPDVRRRAEKQVADLEAALAPPSAK